MENREEVEYIHPGGGGKQDYGFESVNSFSSEFEGKIHVDQSKLIWSWGHEEKERGYSLALVQNHL